MGGVACVLGGAGVSGFGTKRSVCGTWHSGAWAVRIWRRNDVAAAHRVTRMLLDVLGLYKESWLDALP